MKLLSAAEYAEFRAAVQDVTDTFMDTPITYYRHVGMTDSNMEDNVREGWRVYEFKALAEYLANIDAAKLKQFNAGSFDYGDVNLSMNIDDLLLVGLVDPVTFLPNNSIENDYFKCAGVIYKVHDTALDGPLQAKQVLVLMSGMQETKIKEFANIVT